MYVTNPESVNQDRLFRCNWVMAQWLIYKKHISLFGRNNDIWYFAKTDALEEALKDKTFILSILEKL